MTPNPSNTVGDEELITLLRKHTHGKADMAEYRATAIALRAFLATRPASEGEGWRKITDDGPPMGHIVLLAYYHDMGEPTDCWIIASGYRGAPKTIRDSDDYTPWTMDGRSVKAYDWTPTHWRPLPAPPALGGKAASPPLPKE